MSTAPDPQEVRQQAMAALSQELIRQGHPQEYARHMAAAVIFQADLDLCTAQLARLLSWLKETQPQLYPQALELVTATRVEFEQRVQQG
ncbi:MAG: hypothetical protein Q6K99_00605 [Thermostichales cyanobacterium BF4_bins_65]